MACYEHSYKHCIMRKYLIFIVLIYASLKGDFTYAFHQTVGWANPVPSNERLYEQHKPAKADEATDPVQDLKYRCPPCGCSNDSLTFPEEGNCTRCGMPLMPVNQGIAARIDVAIAPFFKSGTLGKVYTKLIYPIFAIGILFSAFLLFFSIRGRSLNVFLIGIILVLSLYGFKNQLYGVNYGLTSNYKSLFTPISMILLIGPLLFFYVKSVLSPSFKWHSRYGFHFIPAVLMCLFYTAALVMPERIQRRLMSSPFEVLLSHTEQIIAVGGGFLYLIWASLSYKHWKAQHADRNIWLAAWLKRFLTGMGLLLLCWGLIIALNFWLYDFGIATITYNPLWVCIGGLLLWLAVEVLANPKFFLIKKRVNYTRNGLMTDEQRVRYQADLEALMMSRKLYTDPDLNLNKLAAVMDIKPRYLSMILNTMIGKNFYDFINAYRIEEVKHLLKDPDNSNLTIEAIAYKGGFKSKSSFNSAFKKHVRMTPREYINSTLSTK